jgi:hypothetical protein
MAQLSLAQGDIMQKSVWIKCALAVKAPDLHVV